MFHPSQTLFGCPRLRRFRRHGSRVTLRIPVLSGDVSSPSLRKFQVWCGPALSLSVYTFTNGRNLLFSIEHFALVTPFGYLAMRFTFISSLSVGHVFFLAVSLTLYMMSARSCHMYSSFPTAVLYTARFSFSSSTSDSVVGVLCTLGVDTDLESSRPSTAITSRMYFGFASTHEPLPQSLCRERRCLTPGFSIRPTVRIMTWFDTSSTDRKTSTLGPNSKSSST